MAFTRESVPLSAPPGFPEDCIIGRTSQRSPGAAVRRRIPVNAHLPSVRAFGEGLSRARRCNPTMVAADSRWCTGRYRRVPGRASLPISTHFIPSFLRPAIVKRHDHVAFQPRELHFFALRSSRDREPFNFPGVIPSGRMSNRVNLPGIAIRDTAKSR